VSASLLPPFVHLVVQRLSRTESGRGLDRARHEVEINHSYPRGPRSCPSYVVSSRHHLIDPIRPHSWAHRDFTAERLIRDVFAVRERLGDPRVVPSFRCTFLPDMPPSPTTGSPYIVSSKFTMPTWSSPHPNRLDTPKTPAIRSRGAHFRGFTGLQLLRPVSLLASLDGSDWDTTQPPELLRPGFRRGGHPSRRWI